MKLELGTAVRFGQEYRRREVDTTPEKGHDPDWLDQKRYQQHWIAAPREGAGYIMGYRTLTDGYTSRDREGGNDWNVVGSKRAALVAYSLNRKPIYVPLDAIIATGGSMVPLLSASITDQRVKKVERRLDALEPIVRHLADEHGLIY